jgi:hypothetical protein
MAAFQSTKTTEQFDFNAAASIDRALINDLLTCRFIHENASVHIIGPVGTGNAGEGRPNAPKSAPKKTVKIGGSKSQKRAPLLAPFRAIMGGSIRAVSKLRQGRSAKIRHREGQPLAARSSL